MNDPGEPAYSLFREGSRFLAEGHPGQAAQLLERASRLAPEKNSVHEALGCARFAMGDYSGAASSFALIVGRAPDDDYAHASLARCLLKQGRAREALTHAKLAVALRPGSDDHRACVAACRLALHGTRD